MTQPVMDDLDSHLRAAQAATLPPEQATQVPVTVSFEPVLFHAAKQLVDDAFVGLPGRAAAYVREVFTMIEHDAASTFGRAYVASWASEDQSSQRL